MVRISFVQIVALLALLAGGKAILYDTLDPDCFWHLKVAEQLRRDGIGPLRDELSYLSLATPWTPYSWLAELGMRGLWRVGGWRSAVAGQAICVAAIVVLTAVNCRELQGIVADRGVADRAGAGGGGGGGRRGGDNPSRLSAALATAVGAFWSLAYLSFRPATLAIALLALCLWLLLRDLRRGASTRAVWGVIPITALLVNIHLYAALVPAWAGCLFLGAVIERRSPVPLRALALFVGTALACCATPMLPGTIATAMHYQFSDPLVHSTVIAEMQPFWTGPAGIVAAILVAITAALIWRRRRELPIGLVLMTALGVLLLIQLGRYAAIFSLMGAPMLAATMPALSDRALDRRAVIPAMALILLLVMARLTIAFPSKNTSLSEWLNRHGADAPGYPCAAADFVADRVRPVSGRLINEFTWGGYLAWRLGDHYRVMIDGRTQVYCPEIWRLAYLGAPDRSEWLGSLGADAAIVPLHNSQFRQDLLRLGWTVAHRDERAEVLLGPGIEVARDGLEMHAAGVDPPLDHRQRQRGAGDDPPPQIQAGAAAGDVDGRLGRAGGAIGG